MELRHLKYFVTVAERHNFTRAAEELHVAQPAISQQIKSLEDELGVSLLHRTKRSVKLTAAGHAFFSEAGEILAHAELSKQIARRAARGETGSLAIGCVGASASGFLPELIRSYRQRFPAVRVHLLELTPEQQLQAFARGKIDVGFTRPLVASDAKNFTQERIYRDRLMLAVPETHALARAGHVRLEKFAGEDFVMFKRSEAPKLADAMMQLCARAGFTPQVVSEPPMIQTVLLAVAAGIGVAIVPGCVRSFRQPGVTILPVRPASPFIDLVLTRPNGEPSPTVAAWLELVRERLPAIRRQMEKEL
ncbi:MAG: LysR family transcriptional regulator [Verrucomicrobiae bacterium]|nr:LysR family transcriptional regulator [Verrucomicrobiae bacterium]